MFISFLVYRLLFFFICNLHSRRVCSLLAKFFQQKIRRPLQRFLRPFGEIRMMQLFLCRQGCHVIQCRIKRILHVAVVRVRHHITVRIGAGMLQFFKILHRLCQEHVSCRRDQQDRGHLLQERLLRTQRRNRRQRLFVRVTIRIHKTPDHDRVDIHFFGRARFVIRRIIQERIMQYLRFEPGGTFLRRLDSRGRSQVGPCRKTRHRDALRIDPIGIRMFPEPADHIPEIHQLCRIAVFR